MATCGIAAGARPVLNTLVEEVARQKLSAKVLQTGCIGMCTLEPIVEVFDKDDNKTTYVLVDEKKAKEIAEIQTIQTKTQIQRTALILLMRTHRIRTKTQTRTAAMRQTAKTVEGPMTLLMSLTAIKLL